MREFPDNVLYNAELTKTKLAQLATRIATGTHAGDDEVRQTLDDWVATLLSEHPKDQQARLQLAWTLTEAADMTQANPNLRELLLRRALTLHTELANEIASNPSHFEQVGHVYRHLGWVERSKGRLDEARQDFEKGAEVFAKLAADKSSKEDGFYRAFQADSLAQLAQVLADAGKLNPESVVAARQTLDVYEGLVADFPDNVDYRQKMFSSVRLLAQSLVAAGQPVDAAQAWRQQISFCEKLPGIPLANIKPHLASAYLALCSSLISAGQVDEAKLAWEKQVELGSADAPSLNEFAWNLVKEPKVEPAAAALAVQAAQQAANAAPTTRYFNTLGVAQYRAGGWADTIESSTRAAELWPDQSDVFNGFFLAMSHWQLDHKDDARMWYDKAVEWMDKNQPTNVDLIRFRAEAEHLLGITPRNGTPQDALQGAAANPKG